MKISGLTTCVGEKYARYLAKSLPIWLDTCDLVTVVTDPETAWLMENIGSWNERVNYHVTNVFTAYDASFNKGAALSSGFATIKDPEWILNFDADVLPPRDWRKQVEEKLIVGCLFGCSHRYREDGTPIQDANFPNIWGFFHLWHVEDPHSWRRPPFEVDVGHAGNYDHSFMRQWPETSRVDLWPELRIIHQGEPRQQWFGNDPKNRKKMANLFMLGLWEAWATKAGHIKVPEPEAATLAAAENFNLSEIRKLLRQFTDVDPFKYRLVIKAGIGPEVK
jgi:hypothetical protein